MTLDHRDKKGDKGDSNTMAAAIVGGLTGAAAGIAAGLFSNLVKWVDNIFGSTRRDPTDEEIITEMMNQMEEDIASLKARMTAAESDINVLQNNMTTQQDKTQYINTYTDALFNSITNFSSAITTTNGIFGESSRINQSGSSRFSSVQTSTINTPYNTLAVNGNTNINGLLYHKKQMADILLQVVNGISNQMILLHSSLSSEDSIASWVLVCDPSCNASCNICAYNNSFVSL